MGNPLTRAPVVLGLGSNIGDRLSHLRSAIQSLKCADFNFQIHSISPIYESPAMLPQDAPPDWSLPFLNLNIRGSTSLSSLDLLHLLKSIECKLGRQDRGRWAPREIDIDILIRGDEIYSSPLLTLPHAGLYSRPFAYLPLLDIAMDLVHHRPVSTPLEQLSTTRSHKTLTELMGILNVTPDSFSDGGTHSSPDSVLNTVRSWGQQGVRILDIGAESTRPGATPLTAQEEMYRLAPVLEALNTEKNDLMNNAMILSLDTRHPETAAWGIQRGINWINDVSGISTPQMLRAVADSNVHLVFMHSLTVPADRNITIPPELDPIDVILQWAETKMQDFKRLGITQDRLIFDPGLGFGKTPQQNWEILRRARKFHDLGVRTLIGHSRKSFIHTQPAASRDLETAAISVDLFEKGIDFLRVHDPITNGRILQAWNQSNGVVRWRS